MKTTIKAAFFTIAYCALIFYLIVSYKKCKQKELELSYRKGYNEAVVKVYGIFEEHFLKNKSSNKNKVVGIKNDTIIYYFNRK